MKVSAWASWSRSTYSLGPWAWSMEPGAADDSGDAGGLEEAGFGGVIHFADLAPAGP